MADSDLRSLEQIKRETEQTRAGLTNTLEQLKTTVAETASDIRQRISPDAIKAEVSNYIRGRSEQLMNDVTAAARRNPMQAVAVGASIAYPLIRIARIIPLPVLVGAGLFFAGSKKGQAITQKASDKAGDLSDEVVRRIHDLTDQVQDTATSAKDYVSDQYDRISSAVAGGSSQMSAAATAAAGTVAASSENIRESAVSVGGAVSDRANSLKEDGLRVVDTAAAAVQDLASGAMETARHAASSITETGMDAARTIRVKASEASDSAGRTILQTIEQNPLLAAGVGLLVGGLIASALPRSNLEDGLERASGMWLPDESAGSGNRRAGACCGAK